MSQHDAPPRRACRAENTRIRRTAPAKNARPAAKPASVRPSANNFLLNKAILETVDVSQVCQLILERSSEFNAVNISTAWKKMSTLGLLASSEQVNQPQRAKGLETALKMLESATADRIEEFDARCCSIVTHVYAKMARKNKNVVEKLEARAVEVAVRMNTQDVANMMWAFAHMGVRPSANFVAAVTRRIVDEIHAECKSQEIANILWGFSTMSLKPSSALVDKLSKRAVAVAHDFKAQEISNLLWALAGLCIRPKSSLRTALTEQAKTIYHTFKAQEISNMLYSFGSQQMKPPTELVNLLVGRATQIASTFKAQEIANVLWSFGTLRVSPASELVGALLQRAEGIGRDFTGHGIAITLWSLTTLGLQPGKTLIDVLAARTQHVVATLNDQDITLTLWGLCGMMDTEDGATRESIRHLMDVVATRAMSEGVKFFDDKGLSALHQCFLSCNQESDALPASVLKIKQMLGPRAAAAFVCSGARRSEGQNKMSATLKKIGLEVHDEFLCPHSSYSIDCLVRSGGADGAGREKQWAVEFDGPSHFLEDKSRSPNGATVLKRKHLRKLGYSLVVVPFFEWAMLKGEAEKEQYLRGQLKLADGTAMQSV